MDVINLIWNVLKLRVVAYIWRRFFSYTKESVMLSLEEIYETKEFRHLRGDIKELIYYSSEEFVVFIDSDVDLDWETTDAFDKKLSGNYAAKRLLCRINTCINRPG